MTASRLLPAPMRAWRIGDAHGRFPVWSAGGARRAPGRWHEVGARVIYASEHYSTALLEKLAHWDGDLPTGQHFVEIGIPQGVSYEVVTADTLPEWSRPDGRAARAFGARWHTETRSAILVVPSVVAPMERNIVIDARHPDFARMTAGLETPVPWDRRLFGQGRALAPGRGRG